VPIIHVCCLAEMPGHVAQLRPSHLVSLVNPEEMPDTPAEMPSERHLRIAIHDICEPLAGCVHPEPEHLEILIAFLERWAHSEASLLIHCFAGVSRSTAAALTALVVKAPGRELDAARALRAAAPHAQPNRRMVAIADVLLGCKGRLIAARDVIGYGPPLVQGPLFSVPLLRERA
jgi:predicted protein tyrosine phosphatase